MSILSKLFADADPSRESSWDRPGFSSSMSSSGMDVSPDAALTVSAVFAAVRLLSDVVAQLPKLVAAEAEVEAKVKAGMSEPGYIAEMMASSQTHYVD